MFGAFGVVVLGLVAVASIVPALALPVVAVGVVVLVSLLVGLERTAVGLVLLGVLLAPMNAVRPVAGAEVVTASDVMFALGFGLLAPFLLTRRFWLPGTFVAGQLIVVSVGLLVSLASDDPALSLNFMSRLVAGSLILPTLFLWWRPGPRTLVALVWAYVLGTGVSVGVGTLQGPDLSGRLVGLTSHPNFFGLTCLLAAAFTPFLWVRTPAGRRWCVVLVAAVSLSGVWTSGSRAALLVVGLLVVLHPVLTRSWRAAVVVGLSGVTGLVLFGSVSTVDDDSALGRLLGGGGSGAADLERQVAFRQGVAAFKDSPVFGGGFVDALAAHNIYLQITVAIGLVGVVGYLLVLFTTFRATLSSAAEDRLLAMPALGYALIGVLTNILWDRMLWTALALCLLAVPVGGFGRREAPRPREQDAVGAGTGGSTVGSAP